MYKVFFGTVHSEVLPPTNLPGAAIQSSAAILVEFDYIV